MERDLRDELSRFPKAWRPQPGDVLVGVVVDVAERTGFAGDRYPVVTVRADDGEDVAFHAYHAVAKDELARLEPKVGETIGIAYHGRHPEKEYARYRIKVVREADVDWEAIRADADAELATQGVAAAAGEPPTVDDDLPF